MDFDDFEREARRIFEAIPPRFREGVDGLTIHRKRLPHPRFPQVCTLGECVTDSYLSDWEGPETVRSRVLLYWGSFRALAEIDPHFDWDEQIRETIDHELRHHLEWLAREDDYEGLDYAMDQGFRRHEGLDFDPGYYRRGLRIGPDQFEVEDEVFIEQRWRAEDFGRAGRVVFAWAGRRYEIPHPRELGDLHFVRIVDGIPAPPYLELVLVRRSSWAERIRAVLRRRGEPVIWESDAVARALDRGRSDRGAEEAEQ